MVKNDSLELLRECDSGIKMGISAIDDVMDKVGSEKLREKLSEFYAEHKALKEETETEIVKHNVDIKEPGAIAKGMSWIKTNVELALNQSDKTIANLMTDGCNMGVKSLNKYLNQYSDSNGESRYIATRLIDLEQRMSDEMKSYL